MLGQAPVGSVAFGDQAGAAPGAAGTVSATLGAVSIAAAGIVLAAVTGTLAATLGTVALAASGVAAIAGVTGGAHLRARRRTLARMGRTITLQRPNDNPAPVPLAVIGFPVAYRPDAVKPPISQGDCQLATLNDEIAAAGWPTPGQGTYAVIDGVTWSVLGASPVYEGSTCIGWNLWIRGGQP